MAGFIMTTGVWMIRFSAYFFQILYTLDIETIYYVIWVSSLALIFLPQQCATRERSFKIKNTRLYQTCLSSAVKSVHVRETEERHCSSDLVEPRRGSFLSLPIPWKYLTPSIGGALPTGFLE
jgi:hypothetical protein